jgi:hypothetical protein
MGSVLYLWPESLSSHTPKFTLTLCALPLVLFGIAYSFRWFIYQVERNAVADHNAAREIVIANTTAYAQEALQLFHFAYQTALGTSGAAKKMIAGRTLLLAKSGEGPAGAAVRCTRLPAIALMPAATADRSKPGQTSRLGERYVSTINALLDSVELPARQVSLSHPLRLVLCVPDHVDATFLAEHINLRARELNIRFDENDGTSSASDPMLIDAWLDQSPGRDLSRYALVMAVQLRETPPDGSAECAVALLLGGPTAATVRDCPPMVRVHRPVASTGDAIAMPLQTALTWAAAEQSSIERLWQAGLEQKVRVSLASLSGGSAAGKNEKSSEPEVHPVDVDSAIGHPGIASGWLAIALAAERLLETNRTQAWVTGTADSVQIGAVAPNL